MVGKTGWVSARIATEEAFVETAALVGAQLKYRWTELEPRRGDYDLSAIRHDLAVLERRGKRLFIQLQDVSFVEARPNVPDYLLAQPEFHGGVAAQYFHPDNDQSRVAFDAWVPRRWDPAVRARLAALFQALAAEFDGKIAGINFAETSIGFDSAGEPPEGYTPAAYYEAMRDLMRSARAAFRKSDLLIYANFMPGESLPEELAAYARDPLHLDYLFWGTEEPYWSEAVVPYLRSLKP
ncbi:MAG: hypothetical protein IH600_07545 [Bacteroidetes bacterium]|nr:hypothetical protein [Bacteroidota bacterium]